LNNYRKLNVSNILSTANNTHHKKSTACCITGSSEWRN